MDMKTKLAGLMAQCLTDTWQDAQGLPTAEEIRGLLAVPPDPKMGDYALPVFRLAKALRMAPPKIATTVVEKWSHEDVARAEAVNGYVNFFLNRVNFAAETLESVLKAGENYGSSDMGNGKTICLDYSSINIAKRFHIGHLSTTMIGHSLRRIYDFLGYKTVGINHLGDWGTQFGKMICAYKLWGNEEEVEKGGVNELVRLYVKFHEEAEKDPKLDDQGRAWFKKIEDGDEEALRIFNWFKALTLRDTERVYKLLGVTFDSYAGESFYNDKMDRVINELKEKNLLTISEGASIVDLSEDNMSPCIILRSDGATLYATRDLAAAIYRHDTYHFDKCLYVVAYQQDLHFRQIFRVLEKMGYEWAKDCVHVAFGMISYEGQALSTRKGHVVYLEDLLEQAQKKAKEAYETVKERLTEVRAALETIRSLEENEETDRTLPSETKKKKKIAELTEQKQQLEQKYNEQYHAANTNRKTYENVQNQQNQMQALEEEYKWVRALSDTACGGMSQKLKIELETYVQMTYFDQILRKANLRFMTMSDGQYELKRQEASGKNLKVKTGLDLNVIDHYNGTERSVRTLSGGESFQASLSLALGLSDEIQSHAGGIQLDAMFVDEGFGSLDEESLNQAVKALEGLAGGNCMVGIISHVPELKERIERKIVVMKSRSGDRVGSMAVIE